MAPWKNQECYVLTVETDVPWDQLCTHAFSSFFNSDSLFTRRFVCLCSWSLKTKTSVLLLQLLHLKVIFLIAIRITVILKTYWILINLVKLIRSYRHKALSILIFFVSLAF